MADPQLENGHSDIANELLEAICRAYFSPAESKVFWSVVRKTYGWHKKSDRISYSQFEESTGLDRRHVGPALKRLISRNILTCTNAGERHMSEYGVQKDYDKWQLSPETVTKSDTDLSNKLTPISVTDGQLNLTPISVPSDTGLGKSDTDTGVRTDTDLRDNKRKKEIQKILTKEIAKLDDWENYLQKKVLEYPNLDVSKEWGNCQTWYAESKRAIKKPQSAFNNWLRIANEKSKRFSTGSVSGNGKHTRPLAKREEYISLDEHLRRTEGD